MRQFKFFWFIVLFVLGAVGVLFIMPSLPGRLIFAAVLVAALLWTARLGQSLDVNSLALATAYVLSVAQFGLYFYFRLPAWLLMLTTFSWVSLCFWLGFKLKIGNITGSAKILSLSAGLAGAEITMALLFWPTHFLVTATVFFMLFYLAWMTANFYMQGLLNWHRTLIHLIFAGVIILVVLLTAQWTI